MVGRRLAFDLTHFFYFLMVATVGTKQWNTKYEYVGGSGKLLISISSGGKDKY